MPGLDARPGVVFAALVVTWVAVVLLVVMVAALHARLRRLERAGPAPAATGSDPPFGALLGRPMTDLAGGAAPRVLLVLSTSCRSCRRLLDELADPGWTVPTAIAWADGAPGGAIAALPDGPRIAAALGVRVTPFGLVAGDDGRITWAGPVTGLPALAERARSGALTGGREEHP